ncbi:hypothetical protein RCC89_18280 [Cytophagaceae bacterium ABcell3]|nr:hypothetical protein RCC89_18280 [Cytophagaceae bacterium ABcell3]
MDSSKKKIINISIPVMVLLCGISSALAFKYFSAFQEAERSKNHSEQTISQLKFTLDSLLKKSKADDFFIHGQYDSAITIYKKMPHSEQENYLIENRESLLRKMNEFQNSLKNKAKNAERKAKVNQNMYGMQLTSLELQYKNRNDSLLAILTDTIKHLNEKISEKEKELSNTPEIDRITFYNNKGVKISYFGEVLNGKSNGQGIGIYTTGSIYDGEWRNNKKHGKGTYKWKEGDVYEGSFVNDKRDGQGTYHWANGNRYEGGWKNDQRSGFGILYDRDNKVILKGNWKDNELEEAVN